MQEESFHRLIDYAKNVNVHFAAQIRQDLLEKATKILMKPIHNTDLSSVGKSPLEKLAALKLGTVDEFGGEAPFVERPKLTSRGGKEADLSQLTFHFPSIH